MNDLASPDIAFEPKAPHSRVGYLRLFLFYFICGALAYPFIKFADRAHADWLQHWFIDSGLWEVLLIPIAYAFDPAIFSREYWRVSPRIWISSRAWIVLAALLIFQITQTIHDPARMSPFDALIVVTVVPFVEELNRSVSMRSLWPRTGVVLATILTTLMWAFFHSYFWIAVVQQLLLTLIFVRTRGSLPATTSAHALMNAITYLSPLLVTHYLAH